MSRRICLAIGVLICGLIHSASAQKEDDPFARRPVRKSDLLIVQRARQILDSPAKWNRADTRDCPPEANTLSLYCALERGTREVSGDFEHRGAAMQEAICD